jgi:hypothetical protein
VYKSRLFDLSSLPSYPNIFNLLHEELAVEDKAPKPDLRTVHQKRVAYRRMLVANARLNGKKTCEAISEHLADLGVEAGTSTVYRDLEVLEAEWREAAALSIAKIKEADLNKLSELEKLLELELHAGSTLDVDKYTELLLRIQDRRSKLLGLDAAKKMEIGGRDGGPIKVQSLKDSELEEIITAGRQTA